MSSRVVAFGEIMLRLKSPGHERLFQSPTLEATFGGAEANVACALAQWGHDVAFATVVPSNALGDAVIGELRRAGVDVSPVQRGGNRLGVYFLEAGAAQRPSTVVYDRAGSAIAEATRGAVDWESALKGAGWLLVSGITPAISATAAELTLEAVQAARRLGVSVACDLNYRANLWKYGRAAADVMREVVSFATVCVAGREDCQQALDVRVEPRSEESPADGYRRLAQRMMELFPNLSHLAITGRESVSASHNIWSAYLYDGATLHASRRYDIADIVDRVGTGDSFTAGLLHGMITHGDAARALEFATAASCLKHSIPGDMNRVTLAEVEHLLRGDGSGRVQR